MKGEERKVEKKIVEYKFQLHAHNGSGSDTSILLNNLSCDKHIVYNIKNGKGIIGLKVFNGYIENIKKNSSTSPFQMWNESFILKFENN